MKQNLGTSYGKLLKNYPDFPKTGIVFVDIMPIFGNAEALDDLIDDLSQRFHKPYFTKVAALESRGFLIGLPLAQRWGLPFVPIRKKGKLPGKCLMAEYELEYGIAAIEVQAESITKDDHVLIIDDLLATGGTMNAANKMVQRITPHVENAFFIELDQLHGGRKLSVPYGALLHL
ncbi:MAG: adenine phosphoribosyltransferase [Bacteroidaceae bacterium]|nr:adenine phosphoribosyltransferase [Bacteroidaceae bacterium]